MRLERELMRGARPMAVMQLLSSGEKYGYELDRQTDGVLKLGQSTLYPMLYNLEASGLVASKEKAGDNELTAPNTMVTTSHLLKNGEREIHEHLTLKRVE